MGQRATVLLLVYRQREQKRDGTVRDTDRRDMDPVPFLILSTPLVYSHTQIRTEPNLPFCTSIEY